MLLGITKRQTKDFDSELNANCWHPQVGFLIVITIITSSSSQPSMG